MLLITLVEISNMIQAVVDGKGLFLDFGAGYPGSLHDARVYQNSSLYQRASNKDILREPVERIGITEQIFTLTW